MENTEMINNVEEIVDGAADAANTVSTGTKLAYLGKGLAAMTLTIIAWEKVIKPIGKKVGAKLLQKKVERKLKKATPAQIDEDVDPSTITEDDLAID